MSTIDNAKTQRPSLEEIFGDVPAKKSSQPYTDFFGGTSTENVSQSRPSLEEIFGDIPTSDNSAKPQEYIALAENPDPSNQVPLTTAKADDMMQSLPTSSFLGDEQQVAKVVAESEKKQKQREHFAKLANDEEYRDNYFQSLGYKNAEDYRKKTADRLEMVLNTIKSNTPDSRFVDYAVYEHSMPVRPMEETVATRQANKVQEAINTLRSNNFWRGFAEGFDFKDIASLGFAQLRDNAMAISALNKANRGEELTQSERSLVDAWKLGKQVEGEISMLGGRSLGANIGSGLAQSMPFVAEMLATGGVAAAATKGISKAIAKKGIQEAAETYVKAGAQNMVKKKGAERIVEGLEKAGLHLAESAIGNAVRVPLTGGVYKNYTGKRLEQFATEDGKIQKYATPAWKDAMKAGFETWTEFFTEDIGKWLDAPLSKVGNSFAHSRLGKWAHLDRIADYKGNKFLTELRDMAKINGLPSEILEEALGDVIINTFYNDKDGWREMASSDYWWQLAGVSALMQGAFVAPKLLSKDMRDYNKRISDLARVKKESLAAIKDPQLRAMVAKAGAAASITERSGILSSIDWGKRKFTKEDAFNAVKYINAQTEFDIAEGDSAETERLSKYIDMAKYLGDRAYRGADGKEDTGDMVQISDNQGNAYTVLSGDIDSNDPDTMLKAQDPKGEVWDVPMHNVTNITRTSISDAIAETYAMMFNQQANQQQLDALQTRISEAVAAGVSTDEVKAILRNNDLEVFEKGDVVDFGDGRIGRVESLNGDHYVVMTEDESGTPNVELIGINDMPQRPAVGHVETAEPTEAATEQTAAAPQAEAAQQATPQEQAVKAVVAEAERAIDQQIDASVNVADGNIYNCVLDGDAVVIRNGNVVLTASGEVDVTKSDPTVVVEYPDGRQRTVSPSLISHIASVENAEQAKENAHTELREVVAQAVEPAMQEEVVSETTPEGEVVAESKIESSENSLIGRSMTEEEAASVIARMQENAAPAVELELTPENWIAEFGESGMVDTPIGEVKMGDNQVAKLFLNKRNDQFGLIKPTLQSPDVIIEKTSPEDGAERDSKYLFIKTFIKPDGNKFAYFESVTVRKEGFEVSVSSHRVDVNAIQKEMQNQKILHLNEKLFFSSEGYLTKPQTEGPDLVPTPNNIPSENKDTTSIPEIQIPRLKNGEVDYNAMSPEMFAQYYLEQYGEDAVVKLARNNLKMAEKIIADTTKKMDAITDPNKMAGLTTKLTEAEQNRQRYQQVLDLVGVSEIEESDADRVARLKQEATPRIAQLFPDGLPNAESVVLADIATGKKIRWSDLERNGNVVSRGLGAELGLSESARERNKRIGLLSNNAPTPEQYAEELPERLNAMGIRYDEGSLRDIVLNVYSSVDSRSGAWNALEQIAQQVDSNEVLDYEDAQAQKVYEQEKKALLGEDAAAETPAEVIDDTAQIGAEELSTEETVPFSLRENAGLVFDDFSATLPEQEASFIDALARSLGVKVEFVDVIPGADANASIVGDKVYIRKKDRTKAIKFLIGHEFTHRMQDLSPEAYASYKAAVKEYLGKRFDTAAARLVRAYEAQRVPYTMGLIEDEVVADFAGELALKSNIFDKFVKAHAEDKTMWQTILDVLRSIREYFAEHFSAKQKTALDHAIDKLENLLEVSSAKVSATNQTAKGRYAIKDISAEEQSIIDAAKANGTYLKAPNGADTNLTPRQWAQVRTKAFKEWFGDWEKAARIEKLRNSEDVSITGTEIEITDDFKQNKKNARKYSQSFTGEYVNADNGLTIGIYRGRQNGGVNEVLQHNYKDVPHIQSVAAIPQIIEKSIYIESQPNYDPDKNPDIAEYQCYVCGLNIGGEEYTVLAKVAVDKNGNRYYDHNLTAIAKGKLIDIASNDQSAVESGFGTTPDTKSTTNSHHKYNELISILQTNSSKVVDANGEPKVVYNGSKVQHYNYDGRLRTKGQSATNSKVSFFTDSRAVAERYGEFVNEVFLNIRNPYEVDYKGAGWQGWSGAEDGMQRMSTDSYADLLANGTYDSTLGAIIKNYGRAEADYLATGKVFNEGIEPDGVIAYNVADPMRSTLYIVRNAEAKDLSRESITPKGVETFTKLGKSSLLFDSQIKSATDNVGTFYANNPDIRYSIKEQDALYLDAVKRGDMESAQRMVNEAAEHAGYLPDTSYQGSLAFNGAAPSSNVYFETKEDRKQAWDNDEFDDTMSLGDYADNGIDTNDLEWRLTDAGNYRRATQYEKESIDNINKALQNPEHKITIYRAVPNSVVEGSIRNGDWVTPSRSYAEYHIDLQDWEGGRVIEQEVSIDDIWWGGDDINEWGYDDGSNYGYRNTENGRKLLDTVVYDDAGNIIPLSERFNPRKEDVRYSVKSAPVFYSNAENAVRNIKQEKATPEQWLKMIEKNGGLKAGEDKWLGLSDWLKASDKKTLTKDEVMEYIRQNQIQIEEVKYREFGPGLIDEAANILTRELQVVGIDGLREKYPDFENYFEVDGNEVLWSENMASEGEYEDYIIEHQITEVNPQDNAVNEKRLSYTTGGLRNKQEIALTVPTIESWNASDEVHFGDAGNGRAIAWVRFGETIDTDGNRVLVIDEVQSKRHQDAREQGYAGVDNLTAEQQPNGIWHIYKDGVFISPVAKWAADTPEKAIRQYERMNRVPAAPFEKNWAELAMKRMLRYAAENGYDKVAWTTGDQQSERYDLSKAVDYIDAERNSDGTYNINVATVDDSHYLQEGSISEKRLGELVGKDITVGIINSIDNSDDNKAHIEADDMSIGGSGMKTFYDTMLVNFMNKYGKKWGVEVGEVTMPELEENNTMHSVDVTDAMRESVMQGQPMFSLKDVPSLVGIHNLSLEKLRKVIKMGGSLANPSVAVVDIDKSDHSDYGDYSLILPKHLVDSRLGRNAGTWAGDAWTPTYPTVVKKIKKTPDISRFYKDINKMPSQISSKVSLDFNSYLEGRSANALYYWYLFEKGEAPELREIPSKFPAEIRDALERITNGSFSMFGLTPEQRAECVDVYVTYKYDGDRAKYEENLQHILEVSQKLVDSKNGLVARKAQQDLESIKEYGFDYDLIARFIRDVEYDVRHSGQVDTDATIRAAQEQVQQNGLESDFEKWRESLDSRYGIEEFIFDGYTPSGNQKWLPHTTENASKWMKKQGRVAATGTFPSFGMFIATVIPRMTSLESIRKRKKQLGNDQETYDAFKDKWEDTYYNLGKKLQPDAHTFEDYGWWRLMEAATKPNPQKYIKEQYNIDFSDEDMATLNTLLYAIKKEYPAKYFETKFERPVALSEFAAAVVPDTIPVPVEEYLRSANLNVYKYDKSVEGSKRETTLKAVDSPNVRFSIKAPSATSIMEIQRSEFEKLTEEYNGLLQNKDKNPNFDEALNEWRDRKAVVLYDYLNSFAESLGLLDKVVLDIFNTRGDKSEYEPIVDIWMSGLSNEDRQKAIESLASPDIAGIFVPLSNGILIDVSHTDRAKLKDYEECLMHEFSHYDDAQTKSSEDLLKVYDENEEFILSSKNLSKYVKQGESKEILSTELLSLAMERIYSRDAFTAFMNGSMTAEEAVDTLKYSMPLMREILIGKLNRHKEYAEQAAERRTTEVSEVSYNKPGRDNQGGLYISRRGRRDLDDEFVEIDLSDPANKDLPIDIRFSLREGETPVDAQKRAVEMERELKAAGVAPEEIAKRVKEATGWERRGKNNFWFYEFSKKSVRNDDDALINEVSDAIIKQQHETDSRLRFVERGLGLARKRIFELYDELRNTRANIQDIASKITKEMRNTISTELVDVMGKRDFDNLIRIIENAVSKGDLETALRQLGEQLVRLEEASLRKAYNKMMNLKLEGTNPRGVSVSRWVDESTRVAINTFKDCLAKGKSAAALDAEFKEEWQYGENKKSRDPWAMWTAIDLLQRYESWMSLDEDIAQIDAEIQEKRQENSELFYEGRIASARGDKAEAFACYRQINKNKEEISNLLAERLQKAESRNNAMAYMDRTLDETITMGRSIFAEQRSQREFHKAEIVKMGFEDCIDLKNPTPFIDEELSNGKQFALALHYFLTAPAYSMNTMLKVISINAPQGEGRLYNHFVRGERGYMAAMANFNAGYNEAIKIYADKAKEIFGKDYEKVLSDSEKDSNIKVHIINGKRVEEIVLPYGTAMYVYMANKMTDGRVKLDKMGISQETIAAMTKELPNEYIQMADWIQEEYLPMLREKYNETHMECFGIPMAKVDNYVPLKILQSKIYKEVDGSGMETTTLPTAIVGAIVKRTRNTLPIDLHVNAFEVIREHVEAMEHWNAYTFVIQDMNALLSSTEFRRMIEHQHPGLFKRLKEAAQITAGTYHDEPTAVDKGFGVLNKLAASSKIAFRVNTAIKQILSYPAFASYAMSADFLGKLARNLIPDVWKSNFDWALENVPGFKARWESRAAGNEKLAQATMSDFDKIIKKVNNIGMWPNAFVDALTCANGAKAVYDYRVDFYKERGYEEVEAHRLAKIDAAEAMNATQQSSEGLFISSLQAKRDLFSVAISTFQNSNFAYLRKQVEAIYEFKRDYETEVEYLIKKYTDSGMSEEEAAELAVKDVRKAKVKAAADLAVFTFGLNILWWFGNNVWKYAFGDDDDREEVNDEFWKALAISVPRNMTIGSIIESIGGGYGASPALFFSDLAQTVNEIQYIAENDPKSWNKSAAYIAARIAITNGVGVDLTTFANIYEGIMGMVRDGYDVEDLMNILNAPQSQARLIAGKPKDGETLDEYQKRMAFLYKRLKSKVDKKDLSRWERDYIAGQQRKLLVDNDHSWNEYNELNKTVNTIRKEMGVTRSGKLNEDARFEYKHSDPTERAFVDEVRKYVYQINGLQKQLDKSIEFNDAYLQRMLKIQSLRKELVEKYEQYND